MPSFVGNTSSQSSPPLCYPPPKVDKSENQQVTLCGCRKAPRSQCLSAIGVLILVLVYTVMGTILFVSLEGDLEEMDGIETAASKPYPRNNDMIYAELRTRTVNQLWSITEDLNVLYKDNWTRLAAQEVKQFQETILQALKLSRAQQTQTAKQPPTPYKWTYSSAFLYSLTLITTIGFGGITPRSQWGRIAALLYALFGIPIVLLYLSTMGEGLSSAMRCIFKRLRSSSSSKSSSGSSSSNSNSSSSSTTTPSSSTANNILGETTNNKGKSVDAEKRQYGSWNHSGNSLQPQHFHNPSLSNYNNNYLSNSISTGNHHKKQKQSAVPISICVMILICYITSGAALFHELQKWGVLESLYFCFTALSTIGFGDLQPKDDIGMYAASAYIIVGMAIVAMCFSLIQTELIIWLRKPNDLLLNDYNSLPRTPRINIGTGFHRNTPARRSTGILESQMEYFVPRSVSEFNLSGVGDLALPPPPKRIQQTIVPITPMTQTTLLSIQKPREKMVTFEDESSMQKCPHGVPTTPSRKSGPQTIIGDVFM
ncbi:CLUMA_CG005383, isoform A [Clunio marinus]|uniref:CLUMA_CG005383, isoform A n=1 Tax=Clunio marinus TaxID=568069 RepID=A0A1J1HUR8_9DIPT|nr:CLUMA_CG005383, isoform A [Clunio marinus]